MCYTITYSEHGDPLVATNLIKSQQQDRHLIGGIMGYPWVVLCCAALCVNLTFSLIPLDGEKVQPPLRYHQDPANGLGEVAVVRVERETVEYSSLINCPVDETSADVTKILETEDRVYSFFFKPLPGFLKLVFHVIVDNDFDISGPYEWKEKSLVVYGWEMKQDTVGEDGWVPVKVEHYRHIVALAPDRLGLKVSMGANGSLVRSLVSRSRWTHDYEGFTAYVHGKAMMIIGCSPSSVTPIVQDTHSQQHVQHSASHVLLGIVVGGCVLILLMVVVSILVLRGPGRYHDQSPPIPKQLPKSMLLKGRDQVWTEPEHIYEDFDQTMLAKLRKKLDLDNLGCFNEEQRNSKSSHSVKVSKGCPWKDGGEGKGAAAGPRDIDSARGCSTGSQRTSENCYENAATLSLLEEKELAWKEDPELGTPPEEQYIEMHGIVSRTSSLLK